MREKQPKYQKAVAVYATPEERVRLKKAFEEFRQALAEDARTRRYKEPPIINVDWPDAFPHLPR